MQHSLIPTRNRTPPHFAPPPFTAHLLFSFACVFPPVRSTSKFLLDFTGNDLGSKGALALRDLFQGWAKKDARKIQTSGIIQTLVLNENNLGSEGIARVCEALTNTSITSLSLDRNIKVGMFSSGKEAGEGLPKFIQATPMLKEFSVPLPPPCIHPSVSLLTQFFRTRRTTPTDSRRQRSLPEGALAPSAQSAGAQQKSDAHRLLSEPHRR
jgi:hypothetical protein